MKQRNYYLSAHTTQGRKLNVEYTARRHLQVHHKAKDPSEAQGEASVGPLPS